MMVYFSLVSLWLLSHIVSVQSSSVTFAATASRVTTPVLTHRTQCLQVWCLKQMKDLMWAADVLFPANTGCISIRSEHEHSLHYIPCISLPMQQSHNAINIMLYHFHLSRPYLFMFFETIQMRSVSGWDLGWLGRTFGTTWRSDIQYRFNIYFVMT